MLDVLLKQKQIVLTFSFLRSCLCLIIKLTFLKSIFSIFSTLITDLEIKQHLADIKDIEFCIFIFYKKFGAMKRTMIFGMIKAI